MTPTTTTTRVITLTNHLPITIREDNWPIVGQAEAGVDRNHQWNRRWLLKVRQHADGRRIVYGVYNTCWEREKDARAGEVLKSGDNLLDALRRVADRLGAPSDDLVDRCMQDMPPVEELS